MRQIIHVGYPKTASSTLQKGLFNQHDELFYIGKPVKSEAVRSVLHSIIYDDEINFNVEAIRKTVNGWLIEAERNNKKTFLLSHEYFARVPNRAVVVRNLQQVLPDAVVLMIIRHQVDMMASYYVYRGRQLDPEAVPATYRGREVHIEDWLNHCIEYPQQTQTFFPALRYYDLAKFYEKIFGRPVRVLLFEDFVAKKDQFITELAGILGIDPESAKERLDGVHKNLRVSNRLVTYHRIREKILPNRFVTKIPAFLTPIRTAIRGMVSGGEAATVNIPPKYVAAINEWVAEGNVKLMHEFDLPLDEYDYPL